MERFSDCASFAKSVLDPFESRKNSARVVELAICKENHSDGVSNYYPMSVKLSATQR